MIRLSLLLASGVCMLAGATLPAMAFTEIVIPPEAEIMQLRDPFRRPERPVQKIARTPLEMFSLDQIKLTGVMTGPNQTRVMLVTPDGKTHFVAERTKIGVRQGVITKITPELIRVREKIVNVLGKEESVETDILLPIENRQGSVGARPEQQPSQENQNPRPGAFSGSMDDTRESL